MLALFRSAQDVYRWKEFAVVAELLATAPLNRHKAFKRWIADCVAESARPVAPRTLERMVDTWNSVPEELRGLLDASKALAVVAAFADPEERVDWFHRAMVLSWAELAAELKALGKPIREDATACPTCGRTLKRGGAQSDGDDDAKGRHAGC